MSRLDLSSGDTGSALAWAAWSKQGELASIAFCPSPSARRDRGSAQAPQGRSLRAKGGSLILRLLTSAPTLAAKRPLA